MSTVTHVSQPMTRSELLAEGADSVHRLSLVEQTVWLSHKMSAIDAIEYGRECVRVARSDSERQRRRMVARRRDIVNDNWQALVYVDLKERLRSELWPYVLGKDGRYIDISRNPFKTILQECAVLYKGPAQRETPAKQADAELYRTLVRDTKFNTFWQQVEFELSVFNDLILWPTAVKHRDKRVLHHNKAAGDTVSVMFDAELGGLNEPFALVFVDSYRDGEGRDRERYLWWTKPWRAVFDDDDDLQRLHPVSLTPIDDEESVRNPYGMHFVYLHSDPHQTTFWDQSRGDDLVELTLKTGRQQTQTNDLFNRSGHKQLVTHGNVKNRSEKRLLDPGAHIVVNADSGGTTVVDWSIDFEARQRVIDNDEARAAGTYGINPERLRKTSYQTAEGARVSERPLEERRHKMREVLADAERDYRDAVITVATVDRLADELPDPEVRMEVIHAPIAYPGDPAKQIEVDSAEIDLGITSVVEVMQRRYPGISRQDAKKRIKANLKLRREIQEIKQAADMPKDPANQSATDEDNGGMGPVVRDNNGQPVPDSPPGKQAASTETPDGNTN